MQRSHRIAPLAVLVAAVLTAATGCGGAASSSTQPSGAAATGRAAVAYDAPGLLTPPAPAPDFALRNQDGKLVRLSQFRGRAVLLTFIYSHCPDVCPLIVANLHNALARLGPRARDVQVIAVSVDPKGDTPRAVRAFLAAHAMTGRMEYLIGSKRELAAVWKRYGVAANATPDSREVDHSAFVYGITGKGVEIALYPADFKVPWIVHDAPLLASAA
jgi:protein SCO1/2